jgi:hypothetical protein
MLNRYIRMSGWREVFFYVAVGAILCMGAYTIVVWLTSPGAG